MTFDVIGELNWLAVVVGGLIYFMLGALWYSPAVFGRRWQKAIGWDPERTLPQMSAASYLVPAIAYVVIAVAIGILARATGSDDVVSGVVLGLVVGVGISVMHTLGDAVFDPNKPEPWTWFAITAGYHAIGQLIVAVVVSTGGDPARPAGLTALGGRAEHAPCAAGHRCTVPRQLSTVAVVHRRRGGGGVWSVH